jgi:hypothetical protein
VAGVVYECEKTNNQQHFAVKILNPVGYKLERKAALKQVIAIAHSCVCICISIHVSFALLKCVLCPFFSFYVS